MWLEWSVRKPWVQQYWTFVSVVLVVVMFICTQAVDFLTNCLLVEPPPYASFFIYLLLS